MIIRILSLALYSCLVLNSHISFAAPTSESNEEILKRLEIFAKVLNYVEGNYVQKVESSKLVYDAIDGMLSKLDPHTVFMRPELFKQIQDDTSGHYAGVGLEVVVTNDVITVIAPIEDSPSDKAGIRTGDQILTIDGKSTLDMSVATAVKLFKGKTDTPVKVVIKEKESGMTREVTLVRSIVKIKSVTSKLIDDKYAYFRISTFQDKTRDELKKEIQQLERDSSGLHGLILDLRNNPGGLLEQAIQVADLFIENGTITSTRGRRRSFEDVRKAHQDGTLPRKPAVVLVNEGSASASEIVAGALQDHKRALVMGTNTFGKGSVQTVIDLENGSALKLTVGTYFTPNGNAIQARGISPDIIVPLVSSQEQDFYLNDGLKESDLLGHLQNPTAPGKEEKKAENLDNQVRTALYHLKTWTTFKKLLP